MQFPLRLTVRRLKATAHKWGISADLSAGHIYASSVPTWVPTDTSPTLWLDANDSSSVEKVDHWLDKSGSGRTAAASGGPYLEVSSPNGSQTMQYDGAQHHTFPSISNIRTVFWVVSQDTGVTPNYRFLLSGSSSFSFTTTITVNFGEMERTRMLKTDSPE